MRKDASINRIRLINYLRFIFIIDFNEWKYPQIDPFLWKLFQKFYGSLNFYHLRSTEQKII